MMPGRDTAPGFFVAPAKRTGWVEEQTVPSQNRQTEIRPGSRGDGPTHNQDMRRPNLYMTGHVCG